MFVYISILKHLWGLFKKLCEDKPYSHADITFSTPTFPHASFCYLIL